MFDEFDSQFSFDSRGDLGSLLSGLGQKMEWAHLLAYLHEARGRGDSPKKAVLTWLLQSVTIEETMQNQMGSLFGGMGDLGEDLFGPSMAGDSPLSAIFSTGVDMPQADTKKVEALQALSADFELAEMEIDPEHDLEFYIDAFGFAESSPGMLFSRRFISFGALSTIGSLFSQIKGLTIQLTHEDAFLFGSEEKMLAILVGLLNAHAEAEGRACPFAVEHGDRVLDSEYAYMVSDETKAMLDASR